jgi:hypothetical protein
LQKKEVEKDAKRKPYSAFAFNPILFIKVTSGWAKKESDLEINSYTFVLIGKKLNLRIVAVLNICFLPFL